MTYDVVWRSMSPLGHNELSKAIKYTYMYLKNNREVFILSSMHNTWRWIDFEDLKILKIIHNV